MSQQQEQKIALSSIGLWLRRGWLDYSKTRLISGLYAALFGVIGLILAYSLIYNGFALVYFILAGGFIITAPALVAGYYRIAYRLSLGERVVIGDILTGFRQAPSSIWAIGAIIAAAYLIWVTDALIVYGVYFGIVPVNPLNLIADSQARSDVIEYIATISFMGFILSFIIYLIALLSIPHACLQRAGFVNAIIFSIKGIFSNAIVMAVWALLLGSVMMFTLLFALPLIVLVFPLLTYANFAAYHELLEPGKQSAISDN